MPPPEVEAIDFSIAPGPLALAEVLVLEVVPLFTVDPAVMDVPWPVDPSIICASVLFIIRKSPLDRQLDWTMYRIASSGIIRFLVRTVGTCDPRCPPVDSCATRW